MVTSYQRKSKEEQRDKVQDALEACVQEGAGKMLAIASEEEVNGFLGYPNALSCSLILTRLFSDQRLFVNPAQTSP